MPRKKERDPGDVPPEAAAAANGPPPDRDLVTFYSRLTHTLENACGRDHLACRLTELRHADPPDEWEKPVEPAMSRAFRRLGRMGAGTDPAEFAAGFAEQVAEAVTRPRQHILELLKLFSAGDAKLALKPVCGATPQCPSCLLTRECDHFNNPRQPEMALLTPAERLMAGNDRALSDAELLAVLIFGEKATGQEPVVSTLLTRYGRLRAVFRADALEYSSVRDIGRSQALRLATMAALHRRLLAERRDDMLRITSAKDIHDRYAAELRDYRVEVAILLMLDAQNNVIRDAWFHEGSPNLAHVGIADLLRPAVCEFASRVALIHNHPSNNPTPSTADMDFTRRLRTACDIFGLGLVDHVIIAENGYYSFAEAGRLGV